MTKKIISNYDKLQNIKGSFIQSDWLEKTEIELNQNWREISQLISLKILRTLRIKGLKQIDLATKLDVSQQVISKWVKGNENFTLDTIKKLEIALDTKLIDVPTEVISEVPEMTNFIWKESKVVLYDIKSFILNADVLKGTKKYHVKEKYGKHSI